MTAKKAQATTGKSGNGVTIPPETQEQHPELIALILGSESMNDEERQYWVNILPVMTPDQIENLKDILLNEKKQLEAIDKKYSGEMEQIGQQQQVKQTEEERRKRRDQLAHKEGQHREEEETKEEEILRTIENL